MRQLRRLFTFIATTALAMASLVALVPAAPAGAAGPTAYAIVESDGCGLAHIDLTTGAIDEYGPVDSEHCVIDLAVSPDGASLYGVRFVPGDDDDEIAVLVRFDAVTGVATTVGQIGDFPIGPGPEAIQGTVTFDSSGALLTYIVPGADVGPCLNDAAFCLFRISDLTAPGAAAVIGAVSEATTVYFGLATSCAGAVVTVRDGDSIEPGSAQVGGWVQAAQQIGGSILNTVNTGTGATTDAANPVGDGIEIQSVDFDSDGILWALGFAGEAGNVYTIDPATGIGTTGAAVGSQGIVVALAIARTCVPTPEPTPEPAAEVIILPAFTG